MKKNVISVVFLIVCCPVCLSQFSLGGLDVDSLLKPDTLKFAALMIADLLVKNKPIAKGLINTGLAALPLLTGPPNLKPEIGSALIPWALENLPKFLKDKEVVDFVAKLKAEVNKVDVSQLNQSDYNAIMNTVIGKTDIVGTFVKSSPDILTNVVMSLDGASDLDPIIAKHLLPVISAKLPSLLNPLRKILHVFKAEVNNINVTDFNMTDNDVFVDELIHHFDILHFVKSVLTMNTASEYFPRNAATHQLGLTDTCYLHTMGFLDHLFRGEKWALEMLDAVGKPAQGIIKGNLHFIGQFDECLAVRGLISTGGNPNISTESSSFGGRYCRATFNLPDSLVKSLVGDIDTHGIQPSLTWGMCLPDSCRKSDVVGIFHIGLLSYFDLTPDSVVCSQDFNFGEDTPAIVTVSVLLLIISVVALCTVIFVFIDRKRKSHSYGMKSGMAFLNNAYVNSLHDTVNRESKQNGGISKPNHLRDDSTKSHVEPSKIPELGIEANGHVQEKDDDYAYLEATPGDKSGLARQIVRAFSFHRNIAQIMSVDIPKDSIRCIFGVRVLSMVMIMLGNSYIYNVLTLSDSPVSANLLDALDMIKRVSFQIVLAGSYETDTFLMLSGCLITYRLINKIEKSGSYKITTWLGFYVQRYFRITPVYMVVMVIFSCLYQYIGNGPLWPEAIHVGDKCKTTWWQNLLYINNLVGVDGNDAYHQCMPWSWQLAVVMQFYLITPILVAFFILSKKLGTAIVILLMLAGIVSSGFKEHRYGGDLMSMASDGGRYWNNVFIKPWCRVSAYCVGVLLGFALIRYQQKRKINKIAAAFGWLLALVVACTFIFVTYTKNRDGGEPWTLVQQAVYESVGRPAWATCIAWVIFACFNGAGGWVNAFLSWRGFIPLSRLTYVVYLLHPVMMVLYVYSKRSLVYLSDYDMIYLLFGHIMINYLAAIPIAATFEYPFVNLERAIKRKLLKDNELKISS